MKNDVPLKDQLLNACRTVPACRYATHRPSTTFENVCADLQHSIGVSTASRESIGTRTTFNTSKVEQLSDTVTHNFVDRRYNRYGSPIQSNQTANRFVCLVSQLAFCTRRKFSNFISKARKMILGHVGCSGRNLDLKGSNCRMRTNYSYTDQWLTERHTS